MTDLYDPGNNQTISQANATSSAAGVLPESASSVALYNTSSTATAYFVCTPFRTGDADPVAVVPTGSVKGSFPIPPGQQIGLNVPAGPKKYATIASAADGALLITPGAI